MKFDPVHWIASIAVGGITLAVCYSLASPSKPKEANPVPVAQVAPPPASAIVPLPVADPRRDAMAAINSLMRSMGGDAIALSNGDMFIIEPGLNDKCTKRDLAKIVDALRDVLLDAGFDRARCTDWEDDKSITIAASKPKPSKPKPAATTPGGLVDPFGGQ